MSIGTAIVITSGKGGTGKTSTAAGVAACLAAMGKRTLCIDADIGLRNLDLTLGMTDQALMDFTDVIQGRCSLEKAAAAHKGLQNLYLITAPVTLPAGVDEDGMRRLMRRVRETFDYCIIDCPAGVGTGFRLATCAADRAIVVCNADAAAPAAAQAPPQRGRRHGSDRPAPAGHGSGGRGRHAGRRTGRQPHHRGPEGRGSGLLQYCKTHHRAAGAPDADLTPQKLPDTLRARRSVPYKRERMCPTHEYRAHGP